MASGDFGPNGCNTRSAAFVPAGGNRREGCAFRSLRLRRSSRRGGLRRCGVWHRSRRASNCRELQVPEPGTLEMIDVGPASAGDEAVTCKVIVTKLASLAVTVRAVAFGTVAKADSPSVQGVFVRGQQLHGLRSRPSQTGCPSILEARGRVAVCTAQRPSANDGRSRGKLLFASNAGMFDPALKPVGLYVEEGREMVRANTRSGYGNFHMKPNGVFFVAGGSAGILETGTYLRQRPAVDLATQSGPTAACTRTREAHPPKLQKKRVIEHTVVFAISEGEVTFSAFARLFRAGLAAATRYSLMAVRRRASTCVAWL